MTNPPRGAIFKGEGKAAERPTRTATRPEVSHMELVCNGAQLRFLNEAYEDGQRIRTPT